MFQILWDIKKGKVHLWFMIDIHSCRVNGIKPFGQGYYVETIGNITDEAVQKYIKEQAEESRKEDSRSTAL